MPSPVDEMLRMLFSEIRAPEGILSMTAIICVWSASASMLALVKGLYAVFDVPKRNYFFMRALAIVYTLAFAIILLVSIGLLVFGDMLYDWLVDYMPPSFPRIINEFKPLMAFLILLLFFWLMFIAIPRRQVSWKNAFWGASFAARAGCFFPPSSLFSSKTFELCNDLRQSRRDRHFDDVAVHMHVYPADRRGARRMAADEQHQIGYAPRVPGIPAQAGAEGRRST